ncbi:MAG: hypothetical protein HRT34_01340 [Alcanivorax sp.]|nr:hypothetical protein [Alcanivorax sp.]
MTSRLDNPLNSYLLRDKRGELLPGGRMEFFDDDTDSPRNVFAAGTDLTVSLGNVVYADAYGLLPDFDLTPNQDYKLRVYDADGAFQWSRGGVANNISNLESRVTALESAIENLNTTGTVNLLTNGSCKAASGVPADIEADWALGELSGVWARVPSVTAGQFRRNLDNAFPTTGSSAELFNVSASSSEAVAEIQWRMPAGDGAAISGKDITLQAKVLQNSGAAMNVYLTVYKLLTENDFDGDLVTISASAPVSVANNLLTELELPIEGPGDLSTGVVVVVSFDCGVVSNCNMSAGEVQLQKGLAATEFEDRPELLDRAAWGDLTGTKCEFPGAISLPQAYTAPDGMLRNRADYPGLWAWVQAHCEVVTEAQWSSRKGCYSSGNETTTFRMPDLITSEPFFRAWDQSGDRDAGEFQDHAIENIEGKFGPVTVYNAQGIEATGAFSETGLSNGQGFDLSTEDQRYEFDFDASRVVNTDPDETRPKNYAVLIGIHI